MKENSTEDFEEFNFFKILFMDAHQNWGTCCWIEFWKSVLCRTKTNWCLNGQGKTNTSYVKSTCEGLKEQVMIFSCFSCHINRKHNAKILNLLFSSSSGTDFQDPIRSLQQYQLHGHFSTKLFLSAPFWTSPRDGIQIDKLINGFGTTPYIFF